VSTSLIYRSASGYELLMRTLYGRHYGERMRAVAEQVPTGASVLELCCGPGTLYRRHLASRARSYIGLDVNEGFVAALRQRGIDARVQDVADPSIALPAADAIIMQASLYHFLPAAEAVVDRMLAAARDRVIVAEPIRNLASSRLAVLGALGRRATDPGTGDHAQRFDEAALDALMQRYRGLVSAEFKIQGGREKIYVLAAGG
jgi:SAM-dependent methyltransferase